MDGLSAVENAWNAEKVVPPMVGGRCGSGGEARCVGNSVGILLLLAAGIPMLGEGSLAEFRLGLLLPPLLNEPVLALLLLVMRSSLLDAALRGSKKFGWMGAGAGLGDDTVELVMVLTAAGG